MKIKLLIISFFLLSTFLLAQNVESEIKIQMNKLIELSKSKSYDKASLLIAYNGENKDRIGNDNFNSQNKDELEKVKRICKKISALIDLSSKYEFTNFTENKNKNEYIIEITFTSGTQNLATQFIFIKTDKGFLLNSLN